MRPLDGVKIVEFATHVVVPLAARTLADWGADVIKIESSAGDPWRMDGRWHNLPIEDDCNPFFSTFNSGKRFVSLNLKTPEGKEALLKLLADADVFMTNIRWAGIQRLGLDYDTLHEMFPRLIYCHFSGYGYEGPDKDKPGFDMTAFWAKSGAYHEFHEAGSRPFNFPGAFGDSSSSNTVLGGIAAALYHRERTGEGMRLTTSLYANGIWCNIASVIGRQERSDGSTPRPRVPLEESLNPFGVTHECQDGEWIKLSAAYPRYFAPLMRALGLEQFIEDERFIPAPDLPREPRVLFDMVVNAFKTRPSSEWVPILNTLDVPFQLLLHSGEVSKDEQAWANGYVGKMVCPNGNEYVVPNSPVTFFGADPIRTTHVGGIGADTASVLTEYGYTPEQIEDLIARGIAAGK